MHSPEEKEKELKHLLTAQPFDTPQGQDEVLKKRLRQAEAYVELENGIAVLSDFLHGKGHILSGSFGRLVGIAQSPVTIDSAFEDEIFGCIPPDDLLERHVMELHYYRFTQTLAPDRRKDYHGVCQVRFRLTDGSLVPVLHRTCYLECLPNGSVWLGLCLYTPCGNAEGQHPVPPQIIDYATGRTIPTDDYGRLGRQLLSPRETEVLALLAQGYSSKQIADRLCIATNTVHRHRQNILTALQVSNTAMAVQIAIRLNLI